MKETNDKIVQEYIERAKKITIPRLDPHSNESLAVLTIEIAKMLQLQDFMDKITTIKK